MRFAYEFHDDSGQWFRAYCDENWEFDPDGLIRRRIASINEHPITEKDRKFHCLGVVLGLHFVRSRDLGGKTL